jgi:hypothetical protein
VAIDNTADLIRTKVQYLGVKRGFESVFNTQRATYLPQGLINGISSTGN